MIIDISKVILTKNKEDTYSCCVENSMIDYQGRSFPIIDSKPFELNVVNEEGEHLNISGNTSLEVVMPCDRCLTSVNVPFDINVSKLLRISDEIVLSEDEEISYINEGELDVDRLLFDEILVDWPSKVLCYGDCKGICPKCGANLNISPCDCEVRVIDPRMAAFQDVFREFKEV